MKAIVYGILIFSSCLSRAQLSPEYFAQFKSDWLQFVDSTKDRATYPWYAAWIQSSALKWDPIGTAKPLPAECASGLESLNHGGCQNLLRTGLENILLNALGVMTIQLEPGRHPFARHVMMELPGGVRLKGLLGLKGDGKKRPLVILRLGIFSNSEEFFPERYLFMQLFEESPFNILILESLSGSEFSQNNHKISVGGFEEGRQNYWIAKKLKNTSEPLSQLIGSIHMVGVSLGGHGVFYSAILNEKATAVKGNSRQSKPIDSFLAFCPLVNLKETFEFHKKNKWSYQLMNAWAQQRLPHLFQIYPTLHSQDMIFDLLNILNKKPYQSLMPDSSLEEEKTEDEDVSNKDFFARNDYFSELDKINTPFYVIANLKDPIVPYKLNAERLKALKNISLITLESGYHCSLPIAYDWHLMSKMYHNHLIKMSKDFSLAQIRQSKEREVLNLPGQIKPLQTDYFLRSIPTDAATTSLLKRWMRAQQD